MPEKIDRPFKSKKIDFKAVNLSPESPPKEILRLSDFQFLSSKPPPIEAQFAYALPLVVEQKSGDDQSS